MINIGLLLAERSGGRVGVPPSIVCCTAPTETANAERARNAVDAANSPLSPATVWVPDAQPRANADLYVISVGVGVLGAGFTYT
jgi:hypothetical protein